MAFTKTWSEADLGSTIQRDIDDIVEDTRYAVRERANVEHLAYADETGHTDVWRHRPASSRTNYGLAANKPATAATGRVDGARYRETDTGLVKYWNGTDEEWVTEGGSLHSNATTTYTTGTVAVTQDSAVVTGTGTVWSTNAGTSDVFLGPDGEYYAISSVDSDTQITLGRTYDGTTAAGQTYTIYLDGHPQYLPKGGGTINGALTVDGATTLTGGATLGAAMAAGDNKITGLAAGDSNGDAVRYEQLHLVAVGTYTGDGNATQAVTGSGVDLTGGSWEIRINGQSDSDNYATWIKTSNDGLYSAKMADHYSYVTDMIISGDADGFTVGNTNNVNANGITFNYVILKV